MDWRAVSLSSFRSTSISALSSGPRRIAADVRCRGLVGLGVVPLARKTPMRLELEGHDDDGFSFSNGIRVDEGALPGRTPQLVD